MCCSNILSRFPSGVTYTLRADIDYPLSRVALLDERSRNLQIPFNFSLKQKTNERICRTVNIRLAVSSRMAVQSQVTIPLTYSS
jgi:hypothetical protein